MRNPSQPSVGHMLSDADAVIALMARPSEPMKRHYCVFGSRIL
jgi:hypothetical protein